MRLVRSLGLSTRALRRHGVRTGLAVGGTALGVASVVATVALGRGAEHAVVDAINALGRDMLTVFAGEVEQTPTRPGTAGVAVTTLRASDADAILAASPVVRAVAPAQERNRLVKYGNTATALNVRGTVPEYEAIRNFPVAAGRYFTAMEDDAAQRVAVLGSMAREVLFPGLDPLGQSIRIGRIVFRVIGVLESKGMSVDGGATEDDIVLIPLRTAQRRVFNLDSIKMIYVQVADPSSMERAERDIAALLRVRHDLDRLDRKDDFDIENPRAIQAAELETAASFRRLIGGLGAVTLVVSGVGILSLMMLSVRERRGEVGLRVAVGARRRDIRTQFLLEAMAIGLVGGSAGVGGGVVTVAAVEAWTTWPTTISVASIALAFGTALLLSGLFGVYPAHRAASWHPVVALSSE